jgi:transposase
MAKHYTLIEKSKILSFYEEGYTFREISKKLNIPLSTININITKYLKTDRFDRKPNSGRPKLLNKPEIDILCSEIEKTPKISSKKLSLIIKEKSEKEVSSRTIRN